MSSKKTARTEDDLGIDLGALNATLLGSLGDALEAAAAPPGALFKLVKLAVIEEDPGNPRQHFDPGALRELADLIRERGFNSAIRIRKNPDRPGHFLICEGHRRYRAALMAGLKEVPALVSDNFERLDQILENLKREPLTEFEIASFIKDQIEKGVKKTDLAKRMRVSPAYITQHLALFNMSETLANAYEKNVVRDLTSVTSLVNLEKSHPEQVASFLKKDAEITRQDIALFRDGLESGGKNAPKAGRDAGLPPPQAAKTRSAPVEASPPAADMETARPPLAVFVKHGGKEARILTGRAARSPKYAWIRFIADADEREVAVGELSLFEVREG